MGAGETKTANLLAPELQLSGLLGELVGKLGLQVLDGRLVVWELVGRVLRVLGELELGVAVDGSFAGDEVAGDEVEQSGLSGTVVSYDGDTRVHVDTKVETLVEVVLLLARVGEGNVVEGDDGGWQPPDVLKVEAELLGLLDLLDETSSLHLVDDLLLGLGLLDQVGVGTGTGDELLDVCDFLLLLVVCLHLVDLVLLLGTDVGGVVTTVVHELLLLCQVHHVGADSVHEVGRVRGENKNVVVGGKVSLEPDDGSEIQVGGRLVKQQDVGLDEERTGKCDTHTPTTRHVLGRLLHHGLGETETRENGTSLGLKGRWVHLLELLVNLLKSDLINLVGNSKVLSHLLETRNLLLGRADNVLECVDVGRLSSSRNKVDVDVLGNLNVALSQRGEERRLSTSVLTEETISLSVVEGDLSTLNKETTMERKGVLVNLDVTTLHVGDEDTVLRKLATLPLNTYGTTVGGEVELAHLGLRVVQVSERAVGRDGGGVVACDRLGGGRLEGAIL